MSDLTDTDLTESDLDRLARRLADRQSGVVRNAVGEAVGLLPLRSYASTAGEAPSTIDAYNEGVGASTAAEPPTDTDPSVVCFECGVQAVTPAGRCLACVNLPHQTVPARNGTSRRIDFVRLLGLQRSAEVGDREVFNLGARTFEQAGGDPDRPNSTPFAHLDLPALRLAAYRHWPEERYWRSPTVYEQVRAHSLSLVDAALTQELS